MSGALRLARERAKAAVYFDEGQIVAALTNLRPLRLVEFLRRAGAVEAARLDEVVREGMSDEHAALALARSGLIGAAELTKIQWRQSSEVLRELLRWTEGEWGFDPRVRLAGGLAGAHRPPLDTARLLVEAARGLPHETVALRMADEDETVAPAEGAQEKADGAVQILPAEAFVLSRVYAPMRLGELFSVSGLPKEETRRAAYALALGGLLERGGWPRALPEEVLRKAQSRPATAGEQPPKGADARAAAEAREPAAETDPRAAVEELLERAAGATHYAVLGVGRTASPDEIKRVYYSLARRLHPDRFRRDADEAQRQQIDAAFAKIAQAYETLKDAARRAAYDLKLSKQGDAAPPAAGADRQAGRVTGETAGARDDATRREAAQGPAPPQDAERKFQQGLAAFGRGDVAHARTLFGEAARLAPRYARYRAHFGLALARDKATRRQAEAELRAAIALDAGNASYYVMLAELYVEVGLRRKAEVELERALSLDATHADARRLLEELRRAG